MNLLSLFDALDECKDCSSTTEKRKVIDEILSSENSAAFTDIASFVHNPFRKAHIKVTDDLLFFTKEVLASPARKNVDLKDTQIWARFKSILHSLETREVTGNSASRVVANFFSSIPEEYYDYFVGIINKDLKIGVGKKILEKHIPNLAPKFNVQLCPSKQWDGYTVPNGGWLVSPKIDGIRGIVVQVGTDGKFHGYRALSRNGHELSNTDHILDELSYLAKAFYDKESVWPVFDGEFYTHGWELSSSIVSTKKTSHPEAYRLQYHVFDMLTYPEWTANQCKAEAHLRDRALANVLKNCSEKIVHVPSMLSVDPDEVGIITDAYVADGYEGSVIKARNSLYEFKRSKAWQKVKPYFDLDAPVTKIIYGRLDTGGTMYDDADPRATGRRAVRSLVVNVAGVETAVGTGLSQDQRLRYAECPAEVVGLTITVRYQRISEDGRLIFPRYQGIRIDK